MNAWQKFGEDILSKSLRTGLDTGTKGLVIFRLDEQVSLRLPAPSFNSFFGTTSSGDKGARYKNATTLSKQIRQLLWFLGPNRFLFGLGCIYFEL